MINLAKIWALLLFPIFVHAAGTIESRLDPYKVFLEKGTLEGLENMPILPFPKSRYETFKRAFELISGPGKIIVELGTSRSFTHGFVPGCLSNDSKYWNPNKPENWDWGAGFFTRMVAVSLHDFHPEIHTVDLNKEHIDRCKVMTEDFKDIIFYHVSSSEEFLKNYTFPNGIDLIYLDTGDMVPLEPTALLHLREAQIIVERNLIAKNGYILIDDVKNQTPKKFGETSDFGKAKYSLPYLLENGFEIVMNEYQVLLRKK